VDVNGAVHVGVHLLGVSDLRNVRAVDQHGLVRDKLTVLSVEHGRVFKENLDGQSLLQHCQRVDR
jgi:hypothetical protein